MLCCAASSTTLSKRWRPFAPVLSVVVPFAITCSQLPVSGIEGTSMRSRDEKKNFEGSTASLRTVECPCPDNSNTRRGHVGQSIVDIVIRV